MNQIAGQYVDHAAQRLELIAGLEKLYGSILAYESAKLLRDVNDVDLSKARDFMTAISQTQIKYVDHAAQRLELIAELEKLYGSILAYESAKLLRDVNDVDLSKARDFMTAISQTQIKVL
nr:hypothetical protein [Tanacetum cinerariifolium]